MSYEDASQTDSISRDDTVGSGSLRPLVGADVVARALCVTPARAYELARLGIIPCVRVGRQVRFDVPKVRAWIEDGGQALAGGWRREREGCG